MQQIKGTILKSRLSFVEQQWGEEGLKQLLATFGEEDRKALQSLFAMSWYPFELGKKLDAAVVDVLGKGQKEIFEQMGAASAQTNLTTVHKTFLTPGKPHAFLGKAQQIYGFYYETGRRTYEQTGESSGVITTYDAETYSAPDCLSVVGWYKRALEMCGATGVSIVEEECRATGGEVCRYRVQWTGATAPA
jgi:uncharacterized protein (TIGR02265 family)